MARDKSNSPNWGGKRDGAGRPTKGELLKVREILDDNIEPDLVISKLRELIENGDYRAIDLYMKYRAGSPTQMIDVHTSGSQDINFKLNNLLTFKDQTTEDDTQ